NNHVGLQCCINSILDTGMTGVFLAISDQDQDATGKPRFRTGGELGAGVANGIVDSRGGFTDGKALHSALQRLQVGGEVLSYARLEAKSDDARRIRRSQRLLQEDGSRLLLVLKEIPDRSADVDQQSNFQRQIRLPQEVGQRLRLLSVVEHLDVGRCEIRDKAASPICCGE